MDVRISGFAQGPFHLGGTATRIADHDPVPGAQLGEGGRHPAFLPVLSLRYK
ncbi:hypothetical protein OIE66_13415 [Nonomuraea sp. NBC_01738]|uniref:hypothetical protein n=1 Tax=Nonomuraea sp. NBC_01738 TaxID=2976003 RepID=UPI002E0DDE05|nr:hypothetical protein OIE66_13415 [Nonomuraea sp. NBC_01738]